MMHGPISIRLIFIVNETVAFRVQDSKRHHLTRICYFNNEVCSQRRHEVQQRELLKVKFALKQVRRPRGGV